MSVPHAHFIFPLSLCSSLYRTLFKSPVLCCSRINHKARKISHGSLSTCTQNSNGSLLSAKCSIFEDLPQYINLKRFSDRLLTFLGSLKSIVMESCWDITGMRRGGPACSLALRDPMEERRRFGEATRPPWCVFGDTLTDW